MKTTFNNAGNTVFVVGSDSEAVKNMIQTVCMSSKMVVLEIKHLLEQVHYSGPLFLLGFVETEVEKWKKEAPEEYDHVIPYNQDWKEKFKYVHIEYIGQ